MSTLPTFRLLTLAATDGDNIGANCGCAQCENSRDAMRQAVNDLIAAESKESDLAQFVERYAERSHATVIDLFKLGCRAYVCDCDDRQCEGFQILCGDTRYCHDLAIMLGKRDAQLTGEELEIAFEVRERENPSGILKK